MNRRGLFGSLGCKALGMVGLGFLVKDEAICAVQTRSSEKPFPPPKNKIPDNKPYPGAYCLETFGTQTGLDPWDNKQLGAWWPGSKILSALDREDARDYFTVRMQDAATSEALDASRELFQTKNAGEAKTVIEKYRDKITEIRKTRQWLTKGLLKHLNAEWLSKRPETFEYLIAFLPKKAYWNYKRTPSGKYILGKWSVAPEEKGGNTKGHFRVSLFCPDTHKNVGWLEIIY